MVVFSYRETSRIMLAKNMQIVNAAKRLCPYNEQNRDNDGVELFCPFMYNKCDGYAEKEIDRFHFRTEKGHDMQNLFCDGLRENDRAKLLKVQKSDLHNHSTKGCRRAWLEERLGRTFAAPPEKFGGLAGMQAWFTQNIKPWCKEREGLIVRWEGAFAEAKRNNIARLAMNFGTPEIDLIGGMDVFRALMEGFHRAYCPETVFEPEITYVAVCNAEAEADRMERYIGDGFFRSMDVCGGEDVQPVEAYLPLYRMAEKYRLIKRMHVGESGTANDVQRAVETLGLDEVHHGIHAAESKKVMRFLADNGVTLHVCPSSNVMLGYAADYARHPIRMLYENGVPVTINTDDLLLFDSSIENEYLRLYQAGTLTAQQLDDIRLNGLKMKNTVDNAEIGQADLCP